MIDDDSWVSRATRLARYTVPRCWAVHSPGTHIHIHIQIYAYIAKAIIAHALPRSPLNVQRRRDKLRRLWTGRRLPGGAAYDKR